MDQGHYNCRDYYISPHFAPTTLLNTPDRQPLYRHESFDELEERSRSPASQKPKFPILNLPLELRQHIFSYLLPYTKEFRDSGLLNAHARNFSAVKKRQARGMYVPSDDKCGSNSSSTVGGRSSPSPTVAASNVVWQRGNVDILRVSKQLHDECAELIYGSNTFLLFVTYSGIKFRFRWLLPSGLAPSRSFDFLDLLPTRYLALIKRMVVHVDHVDPYMCMIKYNVQGKGLAAGLRGQVQRLVDALRSTSNDWSGSEDGMRLRKEKRLVKVNIRVSNGNAAVDTLQNDDSQKINGDLREMLEPFGDLRGVRDVHVGGAITPKYAEQLVERMKSEATIEELEKRKLVDERSTAAKVYQPPLCVYGNDME